jgi:hypothetical protein
MESVSPDWFWFGLVVVVVDLVANLVARAILAASLGLFGVLSSLGHHNRREDERKDRRKDERGKI